MRTWKQIINDGNYWPEYLTLSVKKENSEEIEEISGILIDERLDPATVPNGFYCYDLRHSEDDWSEPIAIERGVLVNFMGRFLVDTPLPINDRYDYMEVVDYCYSDWADVAGDELEKAGIPDDYINYWQNLLPISENINNIRKMMEKDNNK